MFLVLSSGLGVGSGEGGAGACPPFTLGADGAGAGETAGASTANGAARKFGQVQLQLDELFSSSPSEAAAAAAVGAAVASGTNPGTASCSRQVSGDSS